MSKVIVFGSMNMDLSIDAPRVPAAGETLSGSGFITAAGGKGANQAVAAARLGVDVCMVAAVGADGFGEELAGGLAVAGVDVSLVRRLPDVTTGVAVILRTEGENRIVLHAGANHALAAADVAADLRRIGEKNDVFVTQGECDPDATESALRVAHGLGLYTIYNPAPARPAPDDLWPCVDLVCLNETECQIMCGVLPGRMLHCLLHELVCGHPHSKPRVVGRAKPLLQQRRCLAHGEHELIFAARLHVDAAKHAVGKFGLEVERLGPLRIRLQQGAERARGSREVELMVGDGEFGQKLPRILRFLG